MNRSLTAAWSFLLLWAAGSALSAELRVGAAITDITPTRFPVLVNGSMLSHSATMVKTPLSARAIVLDDGRERLAIVVTDSCMIPRPLLDDAKQLAAERTKIKPEHMLISATHTHSAAASMSCLGTEADPTYVPFLRLKLAEAIAAAEANLEAARVGWATADAAEYTALRRWIRRPDRLAEDPFGNPTVRANMHAARNWDDVIGESGPEDPSLSLIAFQAKSDGRPLAVLANFSMHYFGDSPISADYFGLFCNGFQQAAVPNTSTGRTSLVAALSHGCSGDIWRRDYTRPIPPATADVTIDSYTQGLLKIALSAWESVQYQDQADLAMSEARLPLKYRVPDKQRREWAQRIVDAMGDRPPKDTTEVYAREQLILHERQSTEVVVQALRIGDIAIATTPTETYALTGWKLKLQSPLEKTMVIELANGGDGYIPPPEQHLLGGYNTWAARSAGLEVQAEPKIVECALEQLEAVAGKTRRVHQQARGPAASAILESSPVAYWRLDEMAGSRALDHSGNNRDGILEPGVVFFLEGPDSERFCSSAEKNRAAHFAGGRLDARLAGLGDHYSVSLWLWNGMPLNGRPVAGWLFSRDQNHGLTPAGLHLGLGGTEHEGQLIIQHGTSKPVAGRTAIDRWQWNHVALVRDGRAVSVYLNGSSEPEIKLELPASEAPAIPQLFFGGRSDNQSNWEGRLDEIALFDRALTPAEIAKLK